MKTLDEAYSRAVFQMRDPSVHSVRIKFTLNGHPMVADVKREVMADDLPQIYNIRQATMGDGTGSEHNGSTLLHDVEVTTQAKVFFAEPEQTYDFLVEPNETIRSTIHLDTAFRIQTPNGYATWQNQMWDIYAIQSS